MPLGWPGMVKGTRNQGNLAQNQEILALQGDIKELRREIEDINGKLRKQADINDALSKKLAHGNSREEETQIIAQALFVRNENVPPNQRGTERPPALIRADLAAKDLPRGQIVKIDPGDQTLVEINLGKDAGMEKHTTLDVFRPGPQNEYIGMVRIYEVYNQSASCRLVSTNPLKKQTIQVGDRVSRKGE